MAADFITAGLSALGTIFGVSEKKKAARDAQRVARENARYADLAFEEAVMASDSLKIMGAASFAAANNHAAYIELDGFTQVHETLEDVEETFRMGDKFLASQKMAYVKSGIDLAGSPILVMEETREQLITEAKDIYDRATALERLTRVKAEMVRAEGRAKMLGVNLEAANALHSAAMNRDLVKLEGNSQAAAYRKDYNTSVITGAMDIFSNFYGAWKAG